MPAGNPLAELVAQQARRLGPLPFDEVLDLALYHPELGFYARGLGAGKAADFITSPEVGPLFGTVLAQALDSWWVEMRQPDPFVVIEAGAGSGALAAAALAAEPACARALRYVLVERSPAWRQRQSHRLPLEPAGLVLGPATAAEAHDEDIPGDVPRGAAGIGPLVTALAELPVGPFEGVVLANELLDNLAFRLLERGDDRWREVRVTPELTEFLAPAEPEVCAVADRLAGDAPSGARIPIQHRAEAWLRSAVGCLSAGRVVVVDYADTTQSLARRPWTEWVRTYRGHGRGGHPLEHLGEQDVTCEVAVDQLAAVRIPALDRSQADFLRAHGIEELASAARQEWEERAAIGDLQALTARSRVSEAAALKDLSGLGAFRVLEWQVP